jgi:hypothetical protein
MNFNNPLNLRLKLLVQYVVSKHRYLYISLSNHFFKLQFEYRYSLPVPAVGNKNLNERPSGGGIRNNPHKIIGITWVKGTIKHCNCISHASKYYGFGYTGIA